MTVDILVGNCLDILPTLPAGSVHCVVTSPPYFGLRDYGTAQWEGGDAGCDHRVSSGGPSQLEGASQRGRSDVANGDCPRCGARRVDNQIGLEDSPAAYVARMVDVFEEVRRVLRDDGTVWLNIGDSYAGGGNGGGGSFAKDGIRCALPGTDKNKVTRLGPRGAVDGIKPKDLIGIPWRLAFALQDAGWWLRSEIVWAKRAPMPESVVDRPTSATEKIFLLTKSARYFYDADAVREQYARRWDESNYGDNNGWANGSKTGKVLGRATNPNKGLSETLPNASGANMRNFWLLSPEPYKGSHFATFPTEIPRRAILAGTSARGACPECGAPWKRVVEREGGNWQERKAAGAPMRYGMNNNKGEAITHYGGSESNTVGWQPTCTCANNADTVPCVVLDPFLGSGTTLAVARMLGRAGIGIELNPDYAELARERIGKAQPALLALDTLEIA